MEERRSALAELPRYPVVTGAGLIKMVSVASNVNGALEEFEGEIKVARGHEKAGWSLLEELYRKEGRLDLWKIYLEYLQAGREGLERPPFPVELLPDEVRSRRQGHHPGRKVWALPTNIAELAKGAELPKRSSEEKGARRREG